VKVAVLGAGSWGTALTIEMARSGHDVLLWGRDPEVAAASRRTAGTRGA
jgi:glycerol-3-phosphate dehydrogenase (NAD(P)+)